MSNTFRVVLAGKFAKEFLGSPGEAKIIGVFHRSFYVENTSGQLTCIGEWGIGPGPLNALCKFSNDVDFTEIVSAESSARIQNGSIHLGSNMKIDTSLPKVWEPEPFPVGWDLGSFLQNLPFLVERIAETGPREGFAPLISYIASGEEISNAGAFQTVSWQGVSDFGNWLSHSLNKGGNLEFCAIAHQLVGLGPGLTPSGDDFWCGAMIALRVLGYFEISEKISGAILSQAKYRTNIISCAHLECAARGQGAQALHETISAIGMADETRLSSALRALDKIGHTSGWDSLAGVVCVFGAVASWKGHRVLV